MKQSTDQAKYIEPVNFKGTLGKWHQDLYDVRIDISKGDIKEGLTIAYVIPANGAYADTQLISQSKEIAKALQDMIEDLEKHYKPTKLLSSTHNKIGNAKEILKEAGL